MTTNSSTSKRWTDGWLRVRGWLSARSADLIKRMKAGLTGAGRRIRVRYRQWRRPPRVDLFETPTTVEIRIDVPGVDTGTLDVALRGRRLTVTGKYREEDKECCRCYRAERATGRLVRSVNLPCTVRDEQMTANCRDGLLAVSLAKATPEAHIPVTSGVEPDAGSVEGPWSI